MPSGSELILIVAAYGLGCLTAAYYLVRWRVGADVRTLHSGNAGARNAGRVLGRAGFAATFVLDFAKGALAVGTARWMHASSFAVACVALAVVAGHVWPVQLGFRGGKGVATSLGVLALYDAVLLSSLVALFAVLVLFSRRFTMSGLAAFALAPVGGFLFSVDKGRIGAVASLAAIVLFAHRGDLRDEFAHGFRRGREEPSAPEPTPSPTRGNDHGA